MKPNVKELIILRGKSNSGKTSSLKHLMLHCLENPEYKLLHATKYFSDDAAIFKKNLKDNWYTNTGKPRNTSVVFQYKDNIVCITTYGDSLKQDILPALERTIKKFGKCDVFVCGRHDNNNPRIEFQDYNIGKIKIGDKPRATNTNLFENENEKTAEKLFMLLMKSLTR